MNLVVVFPQLKKIHLKKDFEMLYFFNKLGYKTKLVTCLTEENKDLKKVGKTEIVKISRKLKGDEHFFSVHPGIIKWCFLF